MFCQQRLPGQQSMCWGLGALTHMCGLTSRHLSSTLSGMGSRTSISSLGSEKMGTLASPTSVFSSFSNFYCPPPAMEAWEWVWGGSEPGCLCPMEPPCGHGGGCPSPELATPHAFGGSSDLVSLSPMPHPGTEFILAWAAPSVVLPSTMGWSGTSFGSKDWILHLWPVSLAAGGRGTWQQEGCMCLCVHQDWARAQWLAACTLPGISPSPRAHAL